MNTVVLIGRLGGEPVLTETKENHSRTIIQLAVPRSYKNADGIYETDFFRCVLWNGIAKRAKEYCKKGDIIGIRGMLQSYKYEDKNYFKVVAEKVTFLSNKTE